MSGFLGGIDLGSPYERQLNTFTKALELERKNWVAPSEGYVYRGGADLVLQHGQFSMGRKLPEKYEALFGLNETCYLNAADAVARAPELTYYQGWGSIGNGELTSHAWCMAPDGGVVEVTWPTDQGWADESTPNLPVLPPERWAYYGVRLDPALVQASFDIAGSWALLGNVQAENLQWRKRGMPELQMLRNMEFPLLKLPYDPDRSSL